MAIIREMRLISHGLYPPTLESFGLASALKYMASECQTPVVVHCPEELEEQRFPPGIEICVFRIAQESLQNALRHSQATRIDLHLSYEDGELVLNMIDNGVGFDADQVSGKGQGLGLLSMNDRTITCGGKLNITSKPGQTRVNVRIPAPSPAVEK
jgi:NarL family two-component system sensor histidine kinase LiaS